MDNNRNGSTSKRLKRFSEEDPDNADSLHIKPPPNVKHKNHHRKSDQEKSSWHRHKKREHSSRNRDNESRKTRKYELDDSSIVFKHNTEDISYDKTKSSSKSRDGVHRNHDRRGSREIRDRDLKENMEFSSIEKTTSSKNRKEPKLRNLDEFPSEDSQIVLVKSFSSPEKKRHKSYKHEKKTKSKDSEINQKNALREKYDIEHDTRELSQAIKERKRSISSKDLKKMMDQELRNNMLSNLEDEVAHGKESARQNLKSYNSRTEKVSHNSKKKNKDQSKMEISDDSEESSTDSSDDSTSSSESSTSSSDSEDTSSSDDSETTSTSSDDISQDERKPVRTKCKKKQVKVDKKQSNKKKLPRSSSTSSDSYDNEEKQNEKNEITNNFSRISESFEKKLDNEITNNFSRISESFEKKLDNDTPSTLSADQLVKSDKSNVSSPAIVEINDLEMKMTADEAKLEPELIQELAPYYPALQGCRRLQEYQILKSVAEGTYGVVYKAIEKRTKEIVALKRLKMDKEKEGFPITSLREINTLLKAQHPNIVTVREIVVGSDMDKIYIVMDYVEHDLMSFMKRMKQKNQKFSNERVKSLTSQLLKAVAHMHDNWIIHRDLKPSNLLVSNDGVLKVGDFGMAREYGSPLKPYTSLVVTLWYRAPELLLGCKQYSTPVDVWSVGCIFAEILTLEALFPGKSEGELIKMIFKELGTPNNKVWPGYSELPYVKKISVANYPPSKLRQRFSLFSHSVFDLVTRFLTYDPSKRITAEDALKHNYFEQESSSSQDSHLPEFLNNSQEDASAPVGGGFCLKF